MNQERSYFADNLRASAMLLGIVLHAAIPYTEYPFTFPIKDTHSHPAFNLLIIFIHTFRLPIFFLVTGFFGQQLYRRLGGRAFLRHRAKRILLPLVIGMLTIAPLVHAVGYYGSAVGRQGLAASPGLMRHVGAHYLYGGFLHPRDAAHLWFLYYLLFFYAAALAITALAGRSGWRAGFGDLCVQRFVRSPWRVLALACLTLPALHMMRLWNVDSPRGFIPEAKILLYYGLFFGFGWLLGRQPRLIAANESHARRHLIVAVVIGFPLYFMLWELRPDSPNPILKLLTLMLYASTAWAMTLGLLGIFSKHFDRPNAVVRYVADSSYWLYLIHYPLVAYLQVLLAGSDLPSGVKFLTALAVSLPLMLLSYAFCVRYTIIGGVLHGRKWRREAMTFTRL